MVEVGDDVIDCLDADGEAQQTVIEARAREQLFWHLGVRLGNRVGQQALDAAEALGKGDELEPTEHAHGALRRLDLE